MSRRARRIAGWVGFVLLALALASGWRFVPGAGGALDELRWLFRRSNVSVREHRLVWVILAEAEARRQHGWYALLERLLYTPDPVVAEHALRLVRDNVLLSSRPEPAYWGRRLFERWRCEMPEVSDKVVASLQKRWGEAWFETFKQ